MDLNVLTEAFNIKCISLTPLRGFPQIMDLNHQAHKAVSELNS